MRCEYCDQTTPARKGKRFCSNACRVRAHRSERAWEKRVAREQQLHDMYHRLTGARKSQADGT